MCSDRGVSAPRARSVGRAVSKKITFVLMVPSVYGLKVPRGQRSTAWRLQSSMSNSKTAPASTALTWCKFTEDYPAGDAITRATSTSAKMPSVRGLDRWVATLFDDDHIDDTCDRLAGVSEPDPAAQQREAALAGGDRRLRPQARQLPRPARPRGRRHRRRLVDRRHPAERKHLERQLGQHVPGDQLTPNRSRRSSRRSRTSSGCSPRRSRRTRPSCTTNSASHWPTTPTEPSPSSHGPVG